MKKIFIYLIVLLLIFPVINVSALESIDTSAKACIVVEATSGRVLAGTNKDDKLPMASTTKIMTALLAVEQGNMEDVVEISPNASGIEGSSIWLSAGEKLKLKDLLYGLMLSSGNDAALAIAEHIGGSIDEFIVMMNKRAAQMGLKNTNFMNPNGLPSNDHYTTAYDLAMISATAIQNPIFREIVSTKYQTIPWEAGDYDRVLKNKNKLLWTYEDANGIKTGYTKQAGKCLVASAMKNGMQLVSVVLNDGDMWDDSINLLDYGFENYEMCSIIEVGEELGSIPVSDGLKESINIFAANDFKYPMKKGEQFNKKVVLEQGLKAPVKSADKVGYIEIFVSNESVGYQDVYAGEDVERNDYPFNIGRILKQWIR